MTLRAALIGCGRIGADINPPGVGSSRLGSHAAAYAASSRARLVAVCDPDASRREQARRRWNVPSAYASVEEMLSRETIEMVSVASSGAGRGDVLSQLMASGRVRAILAEKPLADTLKEASALVLQAQRSGVCGAVNYVRRFAAGYRTAAAEIQAGALGDVQAVRGIYTKGILNNGSHMLDLLRFLFGEPEDLTVTGAFDEIPGDPTVTFSVRYPGHEAAIIGLRHDAHTIFELDIIGTRGRMTIGDLGHRIDRWQVKDTTAAHGFLQLGAAPVSSADSGLTSAITRAIENLADCVEIGAQPHCSFDDGRAALELALTVKDQAQAALSADATR